MSRGPHTHITVRGATPGLGYLGNSVWAGREQTRVCVGVGVGGRHHSQERRQGARTGSSRFGPWRGPSPGAEAGKAEDLPGRRLAGLTRWPGSAAVRVEEDEGAKEQPRASHQQVKERGPAGLGATALSFSGEKDSPQSGFPSRPAPSPISWPIYETGLSSCLGLVGFPYVFWP